MVLLEMKLVDLEPEVVLTVCYEQVDIDMDKDIHNTVHNSTLGMFCI